MLKVNKIFQEYVSSKTKAVNGRHLNLRCILKGCCFLVDILEIKITAI